MVNAKAQIEKSLKAALEALGTRDLTPQLEYPSDERHGDYSTNVAMKSRPAKAGSPMELAEKIKTAYERLNDPLIEKIEVAQPGFINFWLSKGLLVSTIQRCIELGDAFGRGDQYEGKKVMVEFTDPNPFKEFHVGHLYSNAVGEAICRLLESQGAVVKRANYQGDVGLHVAKAIWGMQMKMKNEKLKMKNLAERSLDKRVKFLGEAYAKGAMAYEEDEKAKEEMIDLNSKIYGQDSLLKELYEKGRQWSLEHFESIYARLGTKFDYYYFESQAGQAGLNLVKEYLRKGIFVESNGAVIFPGEKHGLHNRVFINSQGLPTYEAKELGLAPTKYKDFAYDQSIIVTGNEIMAYFKVLLKALSLINPSLAKKTVHIGHGMVRLPTGKMSSRTGEVLSGEWLLDEVKARMKKRFSDMEDSVAEQVAVGAVKWALLKSSLGKDISFDIDESISLEGNSGPYLQYTFARTQSVLRKAKGAKRKAQSDQSMENEELAILRTLYRFPEVVEEAAAQFAPNILCSFLFSLAQKFNLFYQRHPILFPQVPIENHLGGVLARTPREFRLALTQAVGQTIKNGLHLLGIAAPERM